MAHFQASKFHRKIDLTACTKVFFPTINQNTINTLFFVPSISTFIDMNWEVNISRKVLKGLKKLPKSVAKQLFF
jgi:hypothetical protein